MEVVGGSAPSLPSNCELMTLLSSVTHVLDDTDKSQMATKWSSFDYATLQRHLGSETCCACVITTLLV